MEDPLCNSSFGSMVSLDYVTPDTGYEPKDMELADTNGRNLATSSDIYCQNDLEDTGSFPNVPDVDDDELAEFLAVVVDRTGQPVEVRSNSDQFSCDIRNVKSAQSQFPLVTQSKRMIDQTGGPSNLFTLSHWLKGLVRVLSPHPIHACARGCLSVYFLSFFTSCSSSSSTSS